MLMHSPPTHRRGLTLTEALVATFIAAIGMMALLTLFPLGALQMGQALKDHRCTETAYNAEALMRSYWAVDVVEKQNDATLTGAFGTANGPSDPVFVDPIGRQTTATNIAALGNLQRVSITPANTFSRAYRYGTLLDDMTYDESGTPVRTGSSTGPVERAGRYNWLAVLQRPDNRVTSVANLTVLVFDGRSAGYIPPNAELSYALTQSTVNSSVGTSSISITLGAATPQIGKGRWIAMWTSGGSNAQRFLTFYRVVSVDDSVANTLTLELQTPIKAGHNDSGTGTPAATTNLLVFAGLAEVFERPAMTGN